MRLTLAAFLVVLSFGVFIKPADANPRSFWHQIKDQTFNRHGGWQYNYGGYSQYPRAGGQRYNPWGTYGVRQGWGSSGGLQQHQQQEQLQLHQQQELQQQYRMYQY